MNEIGRRVFEERRRRKQSAVDRYDFPLPLRDAADEIGVSAATLSRIERGREPDLTTLKKICQWLNVSADELLGLTPGAARE